MTTNKMLSLLSASVVAEFIETLNFYVTQTTVVPTYSEGDSQADNHNSDEEIDHCDDEAQPINDSITALKQITVTSEKDKSSESAKLSSKCFDNCKIKPKSKTKYEMIQCSVRCVGSMKYVWA